MRLDLGLLEIFCHVYVQGSFSGAARKLRLSQPTISGHIKNLESYLGTTLFDRMPRKVVPTQAGRLLYRHGQSILNQKEAAIQELKQFLNRLDGSLEIAASTIPGEVLLPRLMAAFHDDYSAVRLQLKISDSEQVGFAVLNGDAELGFAGAKLDTVGLQYQNFATDEMALIAPNTGEWRRLRSITLEELRTRPFLAREKGSGTRRTFETKVGLSMDQFNVVARFGSTGSIREALKVGLGVSVVSVRAVEAEIKNGLLRRIQIRNIPPLKRDFYVVTNRQLTLSPIAEKFLEYALRDTRWSLSEISQ
ncbi:MAG TPA: selenium metabolism-associated LysR family transcriptional regulator [Acidobacteriota bacterium]